jgi:hypothetical protein
MLIKTCTVKHYLLYVQIYVRWALIERFQRFNRKKRNINRGKSGIRRFSIVKNNFTANPTAILLRRYSQITKGKNNFKYL